MQCKAYQEALLEALAEGRTEALGDALEAHLQTCASCREEFQSASRTLELVRTIPVPEPDSRFWANYLPNVRRKIAEAEERRRTRWWHWVPVPLLGTLAVGALALAMIFQGGFRQQTAPPSPLDPEIEVAFPLQPGWEDLAKEPNLLLSDLVPGDRVERDLLAKLLPPEAAAALPQIEEALAIHRTSGISSGLFAYEQAYTILEETTEHERALLLARIREG
ncbi:MAG: hypothetical protein HZA23_03490 [Nitrospirae bacterium]|nr:hypothetical protein [Nitrospirota bacterium]